VAGREIDAFEQYDYAIFNDDLDACVEDLKSIVRAARCKVPLAAPRARAIEKTFDSAKERETA
jgi:guanylate kinase